MSRNIYFLTLLTPDKQPAGRRFSMTSVTFVEAFIRPGHVAEGHMACRLCSDEGAILIKLCGKFGGPVRSALEKDIISLHYWVDRTLHDHCST